MAARVSRLVGVFIAGFSLLACGDEVGNEDGQASTFVKECVAAQQDSAERLGIPPPSVSQLLADCEAQEKLGLPITIAEPGDSLACQADRKTLQVAIETFYANGGAAPVTEAMLVVNGLLRTEFEDFDIVGADVVAVPGGACA